MTRKDTIIVAVLVNSALLITLFVTALKSDDIPSPGIEKEPVDIHPIALPTPVKNEEPAEKKEIEQVLQEFSEKKAVKEEPKSQTIDFAKELEAITKAANPQKENKMPRQDEKRVTVQKGDTLEKIAKTHHVSVDEIYSYNHLATSILQIGQVLKIPPSYHAKSLTSSSSSEESFYTVKQGDNPWSIAVKNHMKLDDLLKLNNLNEEKARKLRPGDKLRIR